MQVIHHACFPGGFWSDRRLKMTFSAITGGGRKASAGPFNKRRAARGRGLVVKQLRVAGRDTLTGGKGLRDG